ncbi:MAG: hypothetical protein DSY55_00320, partial [Clostridia bacterium]
NSGSGTGVAVGGTGVAVGGTGVGGTGVGVGGTGVAVGAAWVAGSATGASAFWPPQLISKTASSKMVMIVRILCTFIVLSSFGNRDWVV